MTKIFADSEEKLLKGLVLYADSDKILYEDEDLTKPVSSSKVSNLALKGVLLISYSGAIYKPSKVSVSPHAVDFNSDDWEEITVTAFDSTESYSVGDVVSNNEKYYICKVAIVPSDDFDATDWSKLTVSEFSDQATYSANDYVTYQDKYYKCKNDIGTAGAFDPTDWDLVECDEFDPTASYAISDYVLYEDDLYICTTAVTPSKDFDSGDWNEIEADTFSSTTTYKIGDYAVYSGDLYICVVDVTPPKQTTVVAVDGATTVISFVSAAI